MPSLPVLPTDSADDGGRCGAVAVPLLLTIDQAAAALSADRGAVYALIRAGQLELVLVDARSGRVPHPACEEYVARPRAEQGSTRSRSLAEADVQAPTSPLLTYEEIAARFRLHPATVRRKVAARLWPSTKVGRNVLFTEAQYEEILRICERPALDRATPARRRR